MMSDKLRAAIERVREALNREGNKLSKEEWVALCEEIYTDLLAHIEAAKA